MNTSIFKNSAGLFVDHEGNTFERFSHMCAFWKLSYSAVMHRLKAGRDLKTALTDPLHVQKVYLYTDPDSGVTFHTSGEIARFFGFPAWVLTNYVSKHGFPVARAVRMAKHYKPKAPIKDHLGNKYATFRAMAAFYGIPEGTLYSRLTTGWPLEKALTTPVHKHGEKA